MSAVEDRDVYEFEDRPAADRSLHLLDVVPELAHALDAEQRAAARDAVRLAVVDLPPGPWVRETIDGGPKTCFGAVVVAGLLTRRVDIGGHPALTLHGPGDMIGSRPLAQGPLAAEEAWAATTPTQIGLFDDQLLMAARRWPRLVSGLFHALQDQHDRLLLQLAAAGQRRVEDRILALFLHLSERFGTVSPEGVVISLRLTHQALGGLIGARRPTVTLAVGALYSRGVLEQRADRSWLVKASPEELASNAIPLGRGTRPVPAEA